LGIAAGPLLNGAWVRYYAALGFDVLTYKTVRSAAHPCHPWPNLVPVECGQLTGQEQDLPLAENLRGTWAVSFGMPSQPPDVWRRDVEQTRRQLTREKLLIVSVVGTVQQGWGIGELAADYARCARWAAEAGADGVEANLSCPNVSTRDGQLYLDPASSQVVCQALRAAVGALPLVIKVGHLPDQAAAQQLLQAVDPHVNAVATTNSIATTVRGRQGEELFGGQRRGICGEGIREASLAQTAMLCELIEAEKLGLEVIGVGGVRTADDVRRYLAAGAQQVQLATSAMIDPQVGVKIRGEWSSRARPAK
jgi:dihydroorotate dehydrogenase